MSKHWSEIEEVGGSVWHFRFMLWVVCHLPLFLVELCTAVICFFFWLGAAPVRARSKIYLEHLRKLGVRVGAFGTYKHILSFALSMVEKLRGWKGAIKLNQIESQNDDLQMLVSQMNQGQGAFLLCSHLGNMEMLRSLTEYGEFHTSRKFQVFPVVDLSGSKKFNALLRELNPELMHDHPLSNVITRCLGDVENRANPETRIYQLHNGDIIMLCSDGLCGICHDDVILDTMIKYHEDPMECKNELISAALSAGGYDNVTIALANIQTDEEPEEEPKAEEEQVEEENTEESVEEEENLSTTVRSEVIGHRTKTKKWKVFLILLLLMIIGCATYIWLAKDNDPVKQTFLATVTPYWNQLMNYMK